MAEQTKHEYVKSLDQTYVMGTYGRHDVVLDQGKGVFVKDVDGTEYMDLAAGIGVNALGYCDDGWVDAVCAQVKKLQHASNYYYTEPTSELAALVCGKTGFSKIFFGNSGCEANECAIKIARKYSFDRYGEGRKEIITLEDSFHGRTITTLSATGQEAFHQYFGPFTDGFVHVPAGDIETLRAAVNEKTCAVMLECVQGEGGVNILETDYVQAVETLCREKDLVFIVDEVQTGIGRTGKLLSYMNHGVQPDVVTLAKGLGGGLPIGACMCREKLANTLGKGDHGTTFGGNPVSCAAGVYTFGKISEPGFLEQVSEKADYLTEKLRQLDKVAAVRNLGLMIGIDVIGKTAYEVVASAEKQGLLVITAKESVRLLPPLTITKEEIDEAVKRFEIALQ